MYIYCEASGPQYRSASVQYSPGVYRHCTIQYTCIAVAQYKSALWPKPWWAHQKLVCEFSCCLTFISHNDLWVLTTGFGSTGCFFPVIVCCVLAAILWFLEAQQYLVDWPQLGQCPVECLIFYRMTPIGWLFWLYQDQKHSIFIQENSFVKGRSTYVVSQ